MYGDEDSFEYRHAQTNTMFLLGAIAGSASIANGGLTDWSIDTAINGGLTYLQESISEKKRSDYEAWQTKKAEMEASAAAMTDAIEAASEENDNKYLEGLRLLQQLEEEDPQTDVTVGITSVAARERMRKSHKSMYKQDKPARYSYRMQSTTAAKYYNYWSTDDVYEIGY